MTDTDKQRAARLVLAALERDELAFTHAFNEIAADAGERDENDALTPFLAVLNILANDLAQALSEHYENAPDRIRAMLLELQTQDSPTGPAGE